MARLFVEGDGPPRLRGQKCRMCGRVAFPPNPYGCEKCGAPGDMLEDHALAGTGRIVAFATTAHANRPDLEVPYTVASIALDDGPVIRSLMSDGTGSSLAHDDPVETEIVERIQDDRQMLRLLRFRKREAI